MLTVAGIYIHIPFCRRACSYCNFHFSTSTDLKSQVVQSILDEAELRQGYLGHQEIETVYFGGGTPSLLSKDELEQIWTRLDVLFELSPDAEVTLEANPDDLDAQKIIALRSSPVNRLSIGVQSFHDPDLRFMGRIHNTDEALHAIRGAQDAGIENISIDLIYGLPESGSRIWERNLEQVEKLGVQHLAAYQLTVEPKTLLAHQVKNKKVVLPPDDLVVEQFGILTQWSEAFDWEHYEISNLSKPGMHSRHNSSYWHGIPYLGLGPSAHSFDGKSRSWNVSNNARYIRAITEKTPLIDEEQLSVTDRYNETVMTGLRLAEGVNLEHIEHISPDLLSHFTTQIQPWIDNGSVTRKEDHYLIRTSARIFADRIASDCFFV